MLTLIIASSNLPQSALENEQQEAAAIGRDKQNKEKVTTVTCCRGDYHSDSKVVGEAAALVLGRRETQGLNMLCVVVCVRTLT